MLIPKWLNKWLTPEEEAELCNPGRRIFTFGLLASAASLVIPSSAAIDYDYITRVYEECVRNGPEPNIIARHHEEFAARITNHFFQDDPFVSYVKSRAKQNLLDTKDCVVL